MPLGRCFSLWQKESDKLNILINECLKLTRNPTSTSSKSTIETLEKGTKYAQI